jgi:ligand-binding sensor domain-containing protein
VKGNRIRIITAAIFLILIAIAAATFFSIRRAQTVLQTEKQKFNESRTVSVEIRTLQMSPSPGVRLISGPFATNDAIEFEGKVFVAGSSGLLILNAEGKILQKFTATDGLPEPELTSLASLNGALWIGTNNSGLIRYSQGVWQQFIPRGKKHRQVTSLLSTTNGELFIGTASGVIRYSGNRFEPFYPSQLEGIRIARIAGEAHRFYIGTFNSGIFAYESGTLNHIDRGDGLLDPMVTDLHSNPVGCYVSTPRGIQSYSGQSFQSIAENLFVTSFEPDSDSIWASSHDRGLILLKTKSALRSGRPISTASLQTKAENGILIKRIGDSLIAFGRSQFWTMSSGRWQPWGTSFVSTLTDSNVSSLLAAPNGELWVGYFDHGIDILDSSLNFSSHLHDETLAFINHLSADQAGNIYVSTANGLVIIGPEGNRRVFRERDGLLSDRVMQAVPLDSDGKRVAIATAQGFTLKEGEAMKSIFAFHGLVNNHVYAIAARSDQIYLGTLGGISRLRDLSVQESWTQVDSGLKRNWVNALLNVDRTLLVGTYGSGVQARTESGDWIQFDALPQDFEVNPNAFFSNGNQVFCGTLDRGFYVYHPAKNSWKQFDKGLPSQNVTAFTEGDDSIIVGTDHGILQISYYKISTIPDLR